MSELESKMKKTIEATKSKFASIRTGRANPELLSRIQVEYYGSMVPLNQTANVSVQDGNMFIISVFDANAITSVQKAIQNSDLGLNPNTEGSVIRLQLPDLTEERRTELNKIVKKEAEEGKVALRNQRRDYLDNIKRQDDATDDDIKHETNQVQKLIDKYTSEIDSLAQEKEAEIMQV